MVVKLIPVTQESESLTPIKITPPFVFKKAQIVLTKVY